MAHNNLVFTQLLKLIPRQEFETLATHHYCGLFFRTALVTVCDSYGGAIICQSEFTRYCRKHFCTSSPALPLRLQMFAAIEFISTNLTHSMKPCLQSNYVDAKTQLLYSQPQTGA